MPLIFSISINLLNLTQLLLFLLLRLKLLNQRIIRNVLIFNYPEYFDQQTRILDGQRVYVLYIALNDGLMEPLLKLAHRTEVVLDLGQLGRLARGIRRGVLYLVQEGGAHEVHDFDLFIHGENFMFVQKFRLEFLNTGFHVQEVLEHT